MKPAKSASSLAPQIQPIRDGQRTMQAGQKPVGAPSARTQMPASPTKPICRCRVMYLGSSVPHITKDGLQGIQEPLRELFPDQSAIESGNAGIDSWLSVWSNGMLIENVDETGREVKRFFKIEALHYCAAVKFIGPPHQQQHNPYQTLPNGNLATQTRFLPLDSPQARQTSDENPPVFASILRRTTGIKVLECHAFICKREAAANALVRCCFHAYADTMYAKQIGADINSSSSLSQDANNVKTIISNSQQAKHDSMVDSNNNTNNHKVKLIQPNNPRRSKSIANLNEDSSTRMERWQAPENGHQNYNSMVRRKGINDNNCDITDNVCYPMNNDLRKQSKFSKSLHHLNQNASMVGMTYNQLLQANNNSGDVYSTADQSTSASCINAPNGAWPPAPLITQPFYTPHAGRVPSYPPQNLIDTVSGGGTLRSIKSMATNSIASTLLRSKKHAKAMSMAQLNHDNITSFHQIHPSNAATLAGTKLIMPPMFPTNIPNRSILNGSQTMKVSSRAMMPIVGGNMNLEAMTPKEMKKLLKKSAKYGIDPSKFGENGLPLMPFPGVPLHPQSCQMPPFSKSGTMISQSGLSERHYPDMPDLASIHGFIPPPPPQRGIGPIHDPIDPLTMKPILVKPNPEFLKSKAGKKWLKQQKEFKKLLPPHLDGLPIVFGPPPANALEPAMIPPNAAAIPVPPLPPIIPPLPGLPMMDTSGYYNHPFYGQNGRASAASTLVRCSPHSQMALNNGSVINGPLQDPEYMQRNGHIVYSNGVVVPPPMNAISGDESSMTFGMNDYGIDPSGRYLRNNRLRHQQRNHMVEQSVISLGEENDYDDDDVEDQHHDHYSSSSHDQDILSQSRRSRGASSQTDHSSRDNSNGQNMNSFSDRSSYNQHGYEQVTQANDDQNSYSSGIYKKGHINERAFSYSIRQEHKSNVVPSHEHDYASRNESLTSSNHYDQSNYLNHDKQQHPSNIYQNKREHSRGLHNDGTDPQSIPVNELSARMENQLNMKSFSNSRIKTHM